MPFSAFLRSLIGWRHRQPFPSAATLGATSAETIFSAIHKANRWRSKSSRSGPGSDLTQTAVIRDVLPILLAELGCKSVLDAPCGDLFWMSRVALPIEHYIGVDVVASLIEENQTRYGDHVRSFLKRDILNDPLPKTDLILCRDCLVHFPNVDVWQALRNLRASGAEYLLTTTFPKRDRNVDIVMGHWRPINLEAAPFCLPSPLRMINERCTQRRGQYADKSLGLWRLAEMPVAARAG